MTSRKIISLSIGISFMILFISGILSYFQVYSRSTATVHTVFGILFSFGTLFHLRNNFRPLRIYVKGRLPLAIVFMGTLFLLGTFYQVPPFKELMDFGAKQKANGENKVEMSTYEVVEMNTSKPILLSIDLLRSEHYWHPQMAVWTEDKYGNYLETLFVSKATAKGLFFGGRSKDNFKAFDEQKNSSGNYRSVNALPIWSHKRGVAYSDGGYVPTRKNPLPDAITGATLTNNFQLMTSVTERTSFKVKIEINVAFDDNEYYSEFDFPEDKIFHSGTGQLGQPSIVFNTFIDMLDGKDYYLMDLIGHGHHSGQNGTIDPDLSTLTTAQQIVERIVVGAKYNP